MAEIRPPTAADEIHRLAREGRLAKEFQNASADRRRRLRAAAGELAGPLLFRYLTRPIEHKRGHHECATGLTGLRPDCLDRYHDDLDAVLHHLFTKAVQPIENLPGWLTSRLRAATVDGHRRRRGRTGAPQRPRVPVWLAEELGQDAWLVHLATGILEWAGNDATAGTALWPLSTWAARRAGHTGDRSAGEAVVAREVEVVLTAMRRRRTWYEKNVERPLGHKQAPVWLPSRGTDGTHAEPEPLAIAPHEEVDALLRQLAALAIDVLAQRIERGEEPAVVASEVLRTVFGSMPAGYGSDQVPGTGETGPDQVVALIEDPDRMDRIVAAVIELLSHREDR